MKIGLIGLLLAAVTVFAQEEVNILIKMIPEQEAFFKEQILKPFEAETKCKVNVSTFSDNWDLKKKLKEGPAVDVIKVPMGMAQALVNDKLVFPLPKVINEDKMADIKRDYFLLKLGTFKKVLYYLPRKFEARIMVYRKSKVKDAVENWQSMKKEIDGAVKQIFKTGLSKNYKLEADPNKWSYLDLLVAGYYWANTPYGEKKFGRIAHRGKDYSGTAIGLIDRCYQMGAKTNDILNVESKYYNDVLRWESLFAHHKIYNSEMWEKGWSGVDIWQAMGEEKVFLSFLTQIDVYFMYGIGDAKPILKEPSDLGFALMPEAVKPDGTPTKKRGVSTGGWLWGIGSKTKNPARAYQLMEFITNRKNQIAECINFGIIPVRTAMLKATHPGFEEEWKIKLYNTSVKQLRTNRRGYLPYAKNFDKVEKKYNKVWKRVMEMSEKEPLKKVQLRVLQELRKSRGLEDLKPGKGK